MKFIPTRQVLFNIWELSIIIGHINKNIQKPYDYLSKHRKTFNTIQHLYLRKTLSKVGIKRNVLILKDVVEKKLPLTVNDQLLNYFLLKWGGRQECLPLFSVLLEIPASAIKQESKMENIKMGEDVVSVFICWWQSLLLTPIMSVRNLFLLNYFSKVFGYKINIRRSILFLFTSIKHWNDNI